MRRVSEVITVATELYFFENSVCLKETVVQMAKGNGVRWYGQALRRVDGHVLRKSLEFEVKGKRKRGRP